MHSLGLGVCAPLNSILQRQRCFWMTNFSETLIFIAATLIFDDSLERNEHFYIGNADFFQESRAKRSFL